MLIKKYYYYYQYSYYYVRKIMTSNCHAPLKKQIVHQVSDLIIPTVETARQMFFLRTYLAHQVPMLFVGPTGTGKSVINKSFLVKLPKEQYTPNCINFSARTSANQTQDIIMAKLDRRRKGVFGPPMGKKSVVFVGKVASLCDAPFPLGLVQPWPSRVRMVWLCLRCHLRNAVVGDSE